METAINLARTNDHKLKFKLAAVIADKSRIISVGYNKRKTHPLAYRTRFQELHAEIDAIVKASKILDSLDSTDLYVARWKPTGIGLAKPCTHCMQLILDSGIRSITYTTDNDYLSFSTEKLV